MRASGPSWSYAAAAPELIAVDRAPGALVLGLLKPGTVVRSKGTNFGANVESSLFARTVASSQSIYISANIFELPVYGKAGSQAVTVASHSLIECVGRHRMVVRLAAWRSPRLDERGTRR